MHPGRHGIEPRFRRCAAVARMDGASASAGAADSCWRLEAVAGRRRRLDRSGLKPSACAAGATLTIAKRLTLAYALHRLLLARVLEMEPQKVPLWRDALGCPQVGAGPLRTSLSHADQWLALAVSRVGPVGVDIEPLTRAGALPEIAKSVCPPRRSRIPGIPGHRSAWPGAAGAVGTQRGGVEGGRGRAVAGNERFPGTGRPDRARWHGCKFTCVRMLQEAAPSCLAAVAGPDGQPVAVARLVPGP